jgi:hypothetical protein
LIRGQCVGPMAKNENKTNTFPLISERQILAICHATSERPSPAAK